MVILDSISNSCNVYDVEVLDDKNTHDDKIMRVGFPSQSSSNPSLASPIDLISAL